MTKSNWTYPIFVAAVVAISIPATTYGVDSPFSRSSLGSIFNEIPGQGGPRLAGRPGEAEGDAKPVTIARVADLLADAGLDATIEGESAASLKLQHNRFSFPIAISLDADRERVKLEMLLTDVSSAALSSERLMGLLASNMDFQPMFFSFSAKQKRIELVSSLANGQVSSETLRNEMSKMAAIAESTASLWETTATPAPQPAAPQTNNVAAQPQTAQPRPTQQAAAPAANTSFVGKWSAARSRTEAFAMQLNQDGTFVLVYVKDGKQSKSSGKFAASGNQLTLTTSDGGKFAGQLGNVTARSFDFTPSSGRASKLTFQRAS